MKKLVLFFVVIANIVLSGCSGPAGVPGPEGPQGTALEAEVFELQNVNFAYDALNGYNLHQALNPQIFASDNLLIYRLSGTIEPQTPIWQSIPRTIYNNQGELDYDFDFSKVDFTIYAGGNYDIALTPNYLNSQTFRIVIIPGAFSNKGKNVDTRNYDAVIKTYRIDDTHVKVLDKNNF